MMKTMLGRRVILAAILVLSILMVRPLLSSALVSPPTISTEGKIVALDVERANMTVSDDAGQVVTLLLQAQNIEDPNATLISEANKVVGLSSLETGQQVRVRYSTDKDGKIVARYIEILDPQPMPAPAIE